MNELRLTLHSKSIDIACVTETHFNSNLYESEIAINGYNCFRQDRNFKLDRSKSDETTSCGGGSVIYVRDNISVEKISKLSGNLDSVAILIDCSIGKLLLSCIYRSPSLSAKQDEILFRCFDSLTKYGDNIEKLFVGDFNLTDVSWLSGSVLGSFHSVNSSINAQRRYLDSVHNAGLSWLLTDEVTRRRIVGDSVQESLLDQVLCTDDSLIHDYVISPPLGKSDHVSIIMEINVDQSFSNTNVDSRKHNWSKVTNLDILKLASDIDWSYSKDVAVMSVEEMWHQLHSKLHKITEGVPFHLDPIPNSIDKCKMPWTNSALKRALKAKNKAWAIFENEPCRVNLNLALTQQEKFEENECKAKARFEKKLTQDLKANSKGFYKYLRNSRKVKSVVTTLEKADGSCTETDRDTAECFSEAFSSVFVREPFGPLPKDCYSTNDDMAVCDPVVITEDDVYHQLSKTNIYKSMGPDEIHPKLIKSLADNPHFVRSLTLLYGKCVEDCMIPSIWKTANVIALHKKGSKKEALNYRPVSLTCILCKVYEQFLRNHILKLVDGTIIPNQHGFVNQKSCFSNILETVDAIISMLEDGNPVNVFYFDFCKAFDSVPHYRLLTKLQNYGITGPMLNIIKDFLTGRSMRTVVRGSFSDPCDVLSGVPQGSVLGPLLFVLFINDLPVGLNNTTLLFADDLKLLGNANDVDSIKQDLTTLEHWESIWLLKFNPSKCKVMHVNLINDTEESFELDGTILEPITAESDLGVYTTNNFKWKDNIYSCIKDANQLISWITRNIVDKDKMVMLNVYKTLIRPKLEYCVQIWNPVACHGNWSIIIEIEAVQRRFTRMINDIGTLPYSERLLALNLTTLAERRIRGDLIETFKIINGIVEYGKDVFKVSRSGNNIVSKVSYDSSNSAVKKLRNSFLSERVKSYWNSLPTSVKTSCSVNMFKANLENYKKDCDSISECNFWDVSRIVLDKIEGPSYLDNKEKHNSYLVDNPYVAKKRNINLYGF